MIQYLYLIIKKKTYGQISQIKKGKIDHRYETFKKLKKKIRI